MNLTSYKLLVHLYQLAKLQQADNRTDIADFLCLTFWDGLGIKFLFFTINKNIGAVSSGFIVPVELTCCSFASTVPFYLIANKTTSKMNTSNSTDLSPYLVNIYVHTKHIANSEQSDDRFVSLLTAIKNWWNRHNELKLPLDTLTAHSMLSLLNMLFGYTWFTQTSPEPNFSEDIFRLQAEIIYQLTNQATQSPN